MSSTKINYDNNSESGTRQEVLSIFYNGSMSSTIVNETTRGQLR